eukprot:205449-Prorocentrum_lima.AAC.1
MMQHFIRLKNHFVPGISESKSKGAQGSSGTQYMVSQLDKAVKAQLNENEAFFSVTVLSSTIYTWRCVLVE